MVDQKIISCCSKSVWQQTSGRSWSWGSIGTARRPCTRADKSTWPHGCGRYTRRRHRTGRCTRSCTCSSRTPGRAYTRRRRCTRRACTGWARHRRNLAGTCTPDAPCRCCRARADTGRSRRTDPGCKGRPARTAGTGRTGLPSWSAGSYRSASRPSPRSWRSRRTRCRQRTGPRTVRPSRPDGSTGSRCASDTRPGTTRTDLQSSPANVRHSVLLQSFIARYAIRVLNFFIIILSTRIRQFRRVIIFSKFAGLLNAVKIPLKVKYLCSVSNK